MSYILEALKKAERQRELGEVPGIASKHEAAAPSPARRWYWLIAAALVLNAVVVGFVLWPDDDPGKHTTISTSPEPAPVQETRTADAEPGAPVAPAPQNAQVESERAEPAAPKPVAVEEKPLIPLPLPQTPRRATPAVEHKAATGPTPAAAAKATGETAQPIPAATAAPVTTAQLPLWPLVPDSVARRIEGRLELNLHVFSKNPDGRFVMLNMKKYGEGERIFEGPYLEEITERGVILSVDGQSFRLNAP